MANRDGAGAASYEDWQEIQSNKLCEEGQDSGQGVEPSCLRAKGQALDKRVFKLLQQGYLRQYKWPSSTGGANTQCYVCMRWVPEHCFRDGYYAGALFDHAAGCKANMCRFATCFGCLVERCCGIWLVLKCPCCQGPRNGAEPTRQHHQGCRGR